MVEKDRGTVFFRAKFKVDGRECNAERDFLRVIFQSG